MSTNRYIYLDNLKWVVAMLVIIHHAACAAGIDPIGYNLPLVMKSAQLQYNVLENIRIMDSSFFMDLFFFISAYFVSSSYENKGAYRFMLDKIKRLGIPTLLTVIIILPIVIGMTYHFMPNNVTSLGIKNATYISILNYLFGSLFITGNIYLGVTWFLWALLVFNTFFVISKKIFTNEVKNDDKKIPEIWKMFLFAIVLIPFNYLGLYLQNHLGENFLGFRLLKNFPTYIVMFYFGIQASKYNWLDKLEFKHAFGGILFWIIGWVLISQIAESYGLNSEMMSRGFTVIGMCMFLLYGFKILFDSQNNLTVILARSAFAAYVVQVIPLSFMAGIYSHYMTQIPLINFIMIAIPSVILSFAIGFVMCKLPVLKNIF